MTNGDPGNARIRTHAIVTLSSSLRLISALRSRLSVWGRRMTSPGLLMLAAPALLAVTDYQENVVADSELDGFIARQMDELGIPGLSLAIINDGRTVYTRSPGVMNRDTGEPVDASSIFQAASLSKPVFAFFVMKLSEKGVIDLDRPLYFYLPDDSFEIEPSYRQVTARMVLGHTTGFPNWRWFDEMPEGVDRPRGDFFLRQQPGTGFTYSGEAYQYLARVIAHLTFRNMNELGELFQHEVGMPLGMKHAYFVWDDFVHEHGASGHVDGEVTGRKWGGGLPHHNSFIFNAPGGLRTEARSYAKFLETLINQEGLWPETYRTMLAEHGPVGPENSSYQEDGITAWSLGFGLRRMGSDTIYTHGGNNRGFQSGFAFSITRRMGYVVFVNCEQGAEFKRRLEVFLKLRAPNLPANPAIP